MGVKLLTEQLWSFYEGITQISEIDKSSTTPEPGHHMGK